MEEKPTGGSAPQPIPLSPQCYEAVSGYFGWRYESKRVEFRLALEVGPGPDREAGNFGIYCQKVGAHELVLFKGSRWWPASEVQRLWDSTIHPERFASCPAFVGVRLPKRLLGGPR
jgi:hypothetical protein